MAQLGPVFREPVDRGKHFRKDPFCAERLIVGKVCYVDTLLFRAQQRSPEQFIMRSNGNGSVGRIHEKTPGAKKPSAYAEQSFQRAQ
jgi:hypothetical protein